VFLTLFLPLLFYDSNNSGAVGAIIIAKELLLLLLVIDIVVVDINECFLVVSWKLCTVALYCES